VRISELADTTGVSVATIKYYVREGLLPPGRKVSGRLSEYDDHHVRRLRLLRALREVGAVPVESLKGLVEVTDDRTASVHEMFGAACDAITPAGGAPGPDPDVRRRADRLVERAGWTRVRDDAPGRDRLAGVLGVILERRRRVRPERVTRYLELIDELAAFELEMVDDSQDRDAMLEQMVVGQVVYGQLLLSLRRLAQEHHSALRFDD
jgi:DNA-binding transcriptional MerR regulator